MYCYCFVEVGGRRLRGTSAPRWMLEMLLTGLGRRRSNRRLYEPLYSSGGRLYSPVMKWQMVHSRRFLICACSRLSTERKNKADQNRVHTGSRSSNRSAPLEPAIEYNSDCKQANSALPRRPNTSTGILSYTLRTGCPWGRGRAGRRALSHG